MLHVTPAIELGQEFALGRLGLSGIGPRWSTRSTWLAGSRYISDHHFEVVALCRPLVAASGLGSFYFFGASEMPLATYLPTVLSSYLWLSLVALWLEFGRWYAAVRSRYLFLILDHAAALFIVLAAAGLPGLAGLPILFVLFETAVGFPGAATATCFATAAAAIALRFVLARGEGVPPGEQGWLAASGLAAAAFAFVIALNVRRSAQALDFELDDVAAVENDARSPRALDEQLARRGMEEVHTPSAIACLAGPGRTPARAWRIDGDGADRLALDADALDALMALDRAHLWLDARRAAVIGSLDDVRARRRPLPAALAALLPEPCTVAGLPFGKGALRGIVYVFPIAQPGARVAARIARAQRLLETTVAIRETHHDLAADAYARARATIGRDVHDGILQTLAGVRMRLVILASQDEASAADARRAELDELQAIVAAEQTALRALLLDGGDEPSDDVDLGEQLAWRAERLARQWSIACRLRPPASPVLVAADLAIEVEMLVREAVANAVRHAEARRVAISLALEDEWLFLALTSDGTGSDGILAAGADESIASRSLRRRLAELGGHAYADPLAAGALLSMRIPYRRGMDG